MVSTFGLALTVSTFAIVYSTAGAEAGSRLPEPPAVLSYQVTVISDHPTTEASPSLGAGVMPSAPFDGAALEASALLSTEAAESAAVSGPRPALSTLGAVTQPPDNLRLHAFSASLPGPQNLKLAPEPAPRPAAIITRQPEASTLNGVIVTPTPAPVLAQSAPEARPAIRRLDNVNITFYDCAQQGFCGLMANGRRVYEGAAACSYNLSLGTRFYIEGDPTRRTYRCDDRGLLSNTWVDVFWYHASDGWRWQEATGRYGTIIVVEWGTERD